MYQWLRWATQVIEIEICIGSDIGSHVTRKLAKHVAWGYGHDTQRIVNPARKT